MGKRICFLVHGTFAANADWIQSNSKLSKALAEHTDAEAVAFRWSGGNSNKDRLEAASRLRLEISEVVAEYPDAEISLVGHSHGGNVIRWAIDEETPSNVVACVYLGTPFLHFQPRPISTFLTTIRRLSVLVFMISLLKMFDLSASAQNVPPDIRDFTDSLANSLGNALSAGMIVFYGMIALVSVLFFVLTGRRRAMMLRQEKIGETLRFTDVPHVREHVLYVQSDEATWLLTSIDKVSNVFARFSAHLTSIADQANRLHWKSLGIMIIGFILLACVMFGFNAIPDEGQDIPVFLYPFFVPVILYPALLMTMVLIVPLLLFTLLAWYTVSMVFRATPAAYGWEGLWTFLLFNIFIDRIPGNHETSRFNVSKCRLQKAGLLSSIHSAFYDDEDVITYIVGVVSRSFRTTPSISPALVEASKSEETSRIRSVAHILLTYCYGIIVLSCVVTAITLYLTVNLDKIIKNAFESATYKLDQSNDSSSD